MTNLDSIARKITTILFAQQSLAQETTEARELIGNIGGRAALVHLYATEQSDGSARVTGSHTGLLLGLASVEEQSARQSHRPAATRWARVCVQRQSSTTGVGPPRGAVAWEPYFSVYQSKSFTDVL